MNTKFWINALITIIPPLALIFMVLGSIISGVATVNQAGAIGAAGAMVMAGYRLQEGRKRAFWPAILAIVSLIAIGLIHSNFNTNIKSMKDSSDQLGVALAIIAVIALNVSLVWSGWRAWKTEDTLTGVMIETCKATSLVFIILLGAAMLTAAFRAFGGEELVREFLNGMPGGFWSKFVIVMAVIFFLGFFLDFIEIAVVVVPIVAPILLADPSANITAVWLGVMIGLNIQTSFLTPPFGFALFYLRGVAPAIVKTIQIYKGVIPFIVLQLLALVVVGLTPSLVNYLPNRVAYLSQTAPPPRNPQLQHCLEQYVTEQLLDKGSTLAAAINTAKELNLSSLPAKLAKNASTSFEQASNAIGLLTEANLAAEAVVNKTQEYRPFHTLVRKIEADIKKIDDEIKHDQLSIVRMRNPDQQAAKTKLQQKVAMLTTDREELAKTIPSEWENAHTEFAKLTKAEDQLRTKYRRAADTSYQPVAEIVAVLKANNALAELKSELEEAAQTVADNPIDKGAETGVQLDALGDKFGKIAGVSSIKSALSSARRSLTSKRSSKEKAVASVEKALKIYSDETAWRSKVDPSVVDKLVIYEEALRDTLGIRSQQKMSRAQALYVASCNSGHRDVSLNF